MDDYLIEMNNITKIFPGIVANDNITLKLRKGEIHALLGENGAGKSTLMSVLFGMYQPENGSIRVKEKDVTIQNPNDANRLGIGMVHQHFKLVGNFSVLENIILGTETTHRGFLKTSTAKEHVLQLSRQYGLQVDLDSEVSQITVGMQQRVEILKMLYKENDILIFDEPTAVLTPQEIEELMSIMKGLVSEGKSILFITHKLDEIKAIADRCTVLRKGKYVGCVDVAESTKEYLSELMVGRKVNLVVEKNSADVRESVLRVKNLCVKDSRGIKNKVNNVTFTAHAGEILCVAGIDGNGQTQLVEAITGMTAVKSGEIYLADENITNKTIRYRNKNGISHIPEDRHKYGLVLDYNISENIVLKEYSESHFQSKGFLDFNKISEYSEELIEKYDIRSGQGAITDTRDMSGGNQQKVIIARELERNHKLLVAMQPARGLDVGAIEQVHKQLIAERDSGKAVLLISLELDEVMNVSDRILVMFEGEIVAELKPEQTNRQELGLYMSSAKKKEEAV